MRKKKTRFFAGVTCTRCEKKTAKKTFSPAEHRPDAAGETYEKNNDKRSVLEIFISLKLSLEKF